ncbi:hypothetical protein NQZ68_026969 [Dissostichus eleginoides]|nr:hypothetical protein NQZ68_026969 [Dissostichus eleginoides]
MAVVPGPRTKKKCGTLVTIIYSPIQSSVAPLRTWMKCRGSVRARPPPPAICQPAPSTGSQPLTVLLLRGVPCFHSEPRRRFHRVCEDLRGTR